MGTLVGIAVCIGNKRAVATAPSEVEPTGIMTFADPAVQALCAKTWGDGTNITYEQAREVTEIPKNWAKDNTTITSFNEIKYFKNCRTIGASAFNGCSSMALTKLELPLCTSIGVYAFLNCASMNADINLPQLTSIGIRAFHNSGIAKVTSLGSITSLPNGEWTGSVYAGVFYGCTQLKTVILPDSLTSIGTGSFDGCKLLESVTFGSNISKIGNNAFSECPNLNIDELNLPLLSSIGSVAFHNSGIVKITSLGSITSLPDGVFNSTYNYIGVFARNEQLKSASLPNSITVLGNGSFNRCTSLTQINIPEGVTSLRQVCFNRCSALESIELPSTVTAIGPSAFQYCTGLTRVSITAATPPSLGSSAFANCSALTGIYVPDESIEAYKTATNWSAYANKILPLSQYNG